MHMVEIHHLSKTFFPLRSRKILDILMFRKKPSVVACQDISFAVKPGELVGLVGPNGSGKTTLLRILATLFYADSGKALVDGSDVVKQQRTVRQNISYVPSNYNSFYGRLTGRQNLEFFAMLHHASSQEIHQKIEQLSKIFEVSPFLDDMFQGYSSGIKQRFHLMRGLFPEVPVFLLDEPEKHLDPEITVKIFKYLKEEIAGKRKAAILFTSHNLTDVARWANRILILNCGCIKAFGSIDDLKKQSRLSSENLDDIYRYFLSQS